MNHRFLIPLLSTVNVLLYLVLIGLWISIPEEVVLNSTVSVVTIVFTAVLLFLNRKRFADFYQSGYFKNLTANLISVFLVFVILGFINFLGFKNPLSWDVTENQSNSLTQQTVQLLNNIDGEVHFRIFSKKSNYELVKSLIELYRFEKNDMAIEFVDAELSPQLVESAGVTKVPGIEVGFKGNTQIVYELSEIELSNALAKVSRANDPVLFFTTGHGEIDLENKGGSGGSFLAESLMKQSYELRKVNLREQGSLSEDIKILFIWGPQEAFFDNEITELERFWNRGGRLVIAFDPDVNGEGLVKLRNWIATKGLTVTNSLAIDRLKNANGSNGTVPLVHKFSPTHPITKEFTGTVFLPLSTSLKIEDTDNWEALALSNLSPAAWGEMNKEEIGSMTLTYEEGKDIKGPLIYTASYKDKKALVYSNSTFVTNNYQKLPQNFQFLLNSVNFFSGEERLISFNNPVIQDRPIFMSANQLGVIFYVSVIFLPLLLFGGSFFHYRRRLRL